MYNFSDFSELGTKANPIVIDDETPPPYSIADTTATYADEEYSYEPGQLDSDADTETMATPEFWENLIDESFSAPGHESARHLVPASVSAQSSPPACNDPEDLQQLEGTEGSCCASDNCSGPADMKYKKVAGYQAPPPVEVKDLKNTKSKKCWTPFGNEEAADNPASTTLLSGLVTTNRPTSLRST